MILCELWSRQCTQGATLARWGVLAACGMTGGCAGAPSLTVAGAYFPAWLACGLAGLVAAVLARVVLVASGLSQLLPLQLLVCSAIGVIAAALLWLLWVGL